MFRVLSDEEAKRVVRWKAPDIGNNPLSVANTAQLVKPLDAPVETMVTPVLQKKNTNDVHQLPAGKSPGMRKVVSVDEPVYKPTTAGHAKDTANLTMSNPSADMLQASFDEGHARGYAEGNAAAHRQSVKELQSVVAALAQSTTELVDETLEQEVLALSLKIAGLLLQREIQVDKNSLCQLIRLGLEQLPAMSSDIRRVYLHPQDADVVRELLDQNANVQVFDEASMSRGQCRLEAGSSAVHAGIDDWLEVFADQLGIVAGNDVIDRAYTDKS